MTRRQMYLLLGALVVGLFVRIPGIFWGYNFPTGWRGHHPDEYTHLQNTRSIIRPWAPQWIHPYPKGMAAHIAVPVLVKRALGGQLHDALPKGIQIIVAGRVVSVLYGTATIVLVFLLARRLFRDPRVAHFAAWIMALGGLHVSQSHYFVSDVPSIFWYLLGSYLLFLELEASDKNNSPYLMSAAFSFGIAFGLKFFIFSIPSIALIALMHRPRFMRAVHIGVFFFVGFVLVNFASYTPYDIANTFYGGIGNPYKVGWLSKMIMYLVELPTVVSVPILVLFVGGSYCLSKHLITACTREKAFATTVIVVIPLVFYGVLTVLMVSQFPRHLVPLIPWICLVSGWSVVVLMDKATSKGLPSMVVVIPLFVYLAVFVYDGERVFLNDTRNEAALWIERNVDRGSAIYWYTPERLNGFDGQPTL